MHCRVTYIIPPKNCLFNKSGKEGRGLEEIVYMVADGQNVLLMFNCKNSIN